MHRHISHWHIHTPQAFNFLVASVEDDQLIALDFVSHIPKTVQDVGDDFPTRLQHWLDCYFSGTNPGQMPLHRLIGTDFQRQVWAALTQISYGETRSYGEIAQAISRPTAVRAVATAIGKNPLPILIPCHRVIQANGKFGNYSGGVDKKKALLALESQNKFDI